MSTLVASLDKVKPMYANNSAFGTLFEQYQKVVLESLISSFGLDFIVKDQHGGDVDTIHNVRAMDHDSKLYYKDEAHRKAYENRGAYNSYEYHSHQGYKSKNAQVSKLKKAGKLYDAYTLSHIEANQKTDLDHIISAKEIHDDKARVLSSLSGADLANNPDNLAATNVHTNRSKKAKSMDEYLAQHANEYSQEQQDTMRSLDRKARKSYDKKISSTYYSSYDFLGSTATQALKSGVAMGLRQVFGLIFYEIWCGVKEEFKQSSGTAQSVLSKAVDGFKRGLENAKSRYHDLWDKFVEGVYSGALSNICLTITNMFLTTSKNFARVLRQIWVSLVQAAKVLFFNPDRLPLGERFIAVAKILATGASVIVGITVSQALMSTAIGAIPVLGEIICDFLGTMVTSIMACTLLYALDKCELIKKIIYVLSQVSPFSDVAYHYRYLSAMLDNYCAQVMDIDLERFKQQTNDFNEALAILDTNLDVSNQSTLNTKLKLIYQKLSLDLPYDTSKGKNFNDFMSDKKAVLNFT